LINPPSYFTILPEVIMSLLIPNNKPLPVQIEIAESALAEAFARDLITMQELEKRLHQVHASHSNSEITDCLKDLPEDLLTSGQAEVYTNLSESRYRKKKKQTCHGHFQQRVMWYH